MSSQQPKIRYFVLSLFAPGLGAADQDQWKKAFALYGLVFSTLIVFGALSLLGPFGYLGGTTLMLGSYLYQSALHFISRNQSSNRHPILLSHTYTNSILGSLCILVSQRNLQHVRPRC